MKFIILFFACKLYNGRGKTICSKFSCIRLFMWAPHEPLCHKNLNYSVLTTLLDEPIMKSKTYGPVAFIYAAPHEWHHTNGLKLFIRRKTLSIRMNLFDTIALLHHFLLIKLRFSFLIFFIWSTYMFKDPKIQYSLVKLYWILRLLDMYYFWIFIIFIISWKHRRLMLKMCLYHYYQQSSLLMGLMDHTLKERFLETWITHWKNAF